MRVSERWNRYGWVYEMEYLNLFGEVSVEQTLTILSTEATV